MGFYMGPIWATHKGLMRDLQHGSMLDPHGQSNVETCGNYMGPVWEKSTHISRKKKQNKKTTKNNNTFLHKWLCPQSQSIWWTGKIPNERGLCTRASYCTFVQSRCLKDIGVFFNSWKWWLHAHLYIPLNFKSNMDIRVKIKTWPWIDVHVGKIVKINLIDTFIL